LAEAHFVQRCPVSGRVLDGWPIGHDRRYDLPQPASLPERVAAAERCFEAEEMPFMREAAAVVCDSMDNAFHKHFGVWPDDVLVVDSASGELVMRGQREVDDVDQGVCVGGGFAVQLDEYFERLEV